MSPTGHLLVFCGALIEPSEVLRVTGLAPGIQCPAGLRLRAEISALYRLTETFSGSEWKLPTASTTASGPQHQAMAR